MTNGSGIQYGIFFSTSAGPSATPGHAYTASSMLKAVVHSHVSRFVSSSHWICRASIYYADKCLDLQFQTGTAPAGATTLYVQLNETTSTAVTAWFSCFLIDAGSSATFYIDTTPAISAPATGGQFLVGAWPGQTAYRNGCFQLRWSADVHR